MALQVFSPAAYALGPMDVIPPDEAPDAAVLAALAPPASAIDALMDSALQEPHQPGRPRERVAVRARAGDEAGGLRMACQEVRR